MKYLRKFATEAEVDMQNLPNVVFVEDTGKVMYNVPRKGAYVQHIDGKLYSADEWVSMGFVDSDANGIAVIATDCKFVMAKARFNNVVWASYTAPIPNILVTSDEDEAKRDFDGEQNTSHIIGLVQDGAAYECINYVFPNGQKGYLPALGEVYALNKYREDVQRVLEILQVEFTGTFAKIWSSTQVGTAGAWTYDWLIDTLAGGSKLNYQHCYGVPFTTLVL